MKRIERLYAVNDTIRRSTQPVSAARLAERFGVSRRTIERDLDALRKAGAPLYATSGRSGGQHSLEDQTRVMLSLSVAEVSALVVGLAAAGDDLPFGDVGQVAVNRLLDVIPGETRIGIESIRSRIRMTSDDRATLGARDRHALEQGVLEQRVVKLTYTDADGNRTKRSVDPVGFLHNGTQWSLVAWCHMRNAGRLFRFSRIEKAQLLKKPTTTRDVDDVLGWVPFELAQP